MLDKKKSVWWALSTWGEGAINIPEIAGSSLTAVNDLLKQNCLSQQIESASYSSSRPA